MVRNFDGADAFTLTPFSRIGRRHHKCGERVTFQRWGNNPNSRRAPYADVRG